MAERGAHAADAALQELRTAADQAACGRLEMGYADRSKLVAKLYLHASELVMLADALDVGGVIDLRAECAVSTPTRALLGVLLQERGQIDRDPAMAHAGRTVLTSAMKALSWLLNGGG